MSREKNLIEDTFKNPLNEEKYKSFLKELLKEFEEKEFEYHGVYIPEAYRDYIESYKRIGKFKDDSDKEIDLLIVYLKKETSLVRARSAQRNFIAWYLNGGRGGKLKDAALVAFAVKDYPDWRFSLVKVDYGFSESGAVERRITPAKRYSYLVGPNEGTHTAESRFLPLLEKREKPTLKELEEAFSVEPITDEFYKEYRNIFIRTVEELNKLLKSNPALKKEFEAKGIESVGFAKKLLGQIVFLYFLQKKGWFGVERGKPWGSGPRDFIRRLFNKEYGDYQNFYNDILEPLFYEALRTDRSSDDHYYSRFNCRIPFLNGGLFDPPNNFDWVNVDILLPNELFSNENKDGILDVLDRYNFTVNEEEPLDKEVALDPELLGKIYEKLNAIRSDNFDEYVRVLKSGKKGDETKFNKEYGVYYTPREIVHYMCQESLINYLENGLAGRVKREDIEKFVRYADLFLENEITAVERREKIERGEQKETKYEHKIPESIIQNAQFIDKLLEDIKICDPAVGSGAFLVEMLHEIVKLRQFLSVYRSNTGIPACESGSNTSILACESKSTTGILTCEGELKITRRNLLHWYKPGSIYWVTFRLADSLPQEKLNQWREEYEIWLKHNPKPWNEKQWKEYNEKFGERLEKWLDSGYGSCILARQEIREILKECLFKFDKKRHLIHAVVIMPNHVHLLIEPFPGYSLSELLKGIKGASAYYINKLLNSTGKKNLDGRIIRPYCAKRKRIFPFCSIYYKQPEKS